MNWLYSDGGNCVIKPDKVEALKIFYDSYDEKAWFLVAYTGAGAVHTLGSYDTREHAVEAMNNALRQIKSEEMDARCHTFSF